MSNNINSNTFNENPEAKVERISLAELRAEVKKIKQEEFDANQERFDKLFLKFLQEYEKLSPEKSQKYLKTKQ